MSETLDKAKAAMEAARPLAPELPENADKKDRDLMYLDLLNIARVQAEIAQAEALERIADLLEPKWQPYDPTAVPPTPPGPRR